MPQFMDFHSYLKLPARGIAELTEATRNHATDEFGVRQVELYHNPDGTVFCLLDGPDAESIKKHHDALGIECGDIHPVNSLL